MYVESPPGRSPRATIPRREWHNRQISKRASAIRKPQRSRKPGMKSSPCLRTRHAMSTAGRHLTFTERLCARGLNPVNAADVCPPCAAIPWNRHRFTENGSRNIPNTVCGLVGTFLISAKMFLLPCVLWAISGTFLSCS
jgi:hypothetical protein